MRVLRIDEHSPFRRLLGIGGLGTGIFFKLEGNDTLGRNESRPARLMGVRDYCKQHIVIYYIAKLLGAQPSGFPFHVLPVGNVGDDSAGQRVIADMQGAGIDTRQVKKLSGVPTLFSVCFQYPDGSGGNITTSNSAAGQLTNGDIDSAVRFVQPNSRQVIALAVPEVPLDVRRHFLTEATKLGAFRAASFVSGEVRPAWDTGMFDMLDLLALNQSEAEQFAGSEFVTENPVPFVIQCQNCLRTRYPGLSLVISAGKHGAYAVTAQAYDFCAAPAVAVASTAGAGDALLGGMLAALAAGVPLMHVGSATKKQPEEITIETALQIGVLLASYKCLSPHTIHPSACLDTLVQFAADRGSSFAPTLQQLFVTSPAAQTLA